MHLANCNDYLDGKFPWFVGVNFPVLLLKCVFVLKQPNGFMESCIFLFIFFSSTEHVNSVSLCINTMLCVLISSVSRHLTIVVLLRQSVFIVNYFHILQNNHRVIGKYGKKNQRMGAGYLYTFTSRLNCLLPPKRRSKWPPEVCHLVS